MPTRFDVPEPLTDVPILTQFAVVSSAARGRSQDVIAAHTGLGLSLVQRICVHYGGSHLGQLEAAANKLRGLTELANHGPAAELVDEPATPPPASVLRVLAGLRSRAASIGDRKLAHRADWLAKHFQLITDDLAKAEAEYLHRRQEIAQAAQMEEEQRAAKQAQLDKAREAADRATKRAKSEAARAARIASELARPTQIERTQAKAWAIANGIELPRGVTPKRVVDQWIEAGRP